ncbi:MAG: DNA double-strand break repair nuclease NurA [Actinomycetota bacterium]|nr:DNA double-strand break repair nuclease NurA [Actinomycetota bacterium]
MADLDQTARRLAELLTRGGDRLSDPTGSDLRMEAELTLLPLERASAPRDVWALDGGQAVVADARCVQLVVTRAATVRWKDGAVVVEDEGHLDAHLVGLGEGRATLERSGAPADPDAAVDVNLLRDWGEWRAAAAAVEACEPGGVVMVDGDLQPDWRIHSTWVGALLARAGERRVLLAGFTKHSSLARGGAPLVGSLEAEAEARFGPRSTWWAKVASTRPELGPGLSVCVARLDPDARFAFRVDLPGDADLPAALGSLSALCDDAAFPGYPYPLSVADRLAACPGWVKADAWSRVEATLESAGVAPEVRERAFTDRHRLMERA